MTLTVPRGWLILVFLLCFSCVAEAQQSLLGDADTPNSLVWLRNQYPASMSRVEVAEMLNRLAWAHRGDGWGLLKKGSGNSCPLADLNVSCDILIHKPSIQHFDVLIDAENTARPTWNNVGPCVIGPSSGCDMKNFLEPMDPHIDPSDPPDPPDVPPVDLGPILTRLTVLEADVRDLRASYDSHAVELNAHLEALQRLDAVTKQHAGAIARIDAFLASRPWPTRCFARIASLIPVHCELEP